MTDEGGSGKGRRTLLVQLHTTLDPAELSDHITSLVINSHLHWEISFMAWEQEPQQLPDAFSVISGKRKGIHRSGQKSKPDKYELHLTITVRLKGRSVVAGKGPESLRE